MGYKFALELYSVREALKQDLWGTLRAVKSMGYDGVEFAGHFNHSAQEISAALHDTGLTCCGWHTPWDYVQSQYIMSTITYNKVIGNPYIIIPGLPHEFTSSKQAWLDTAVQFNTIGAVLKDYGMYLGYHNHSEEVKPLEGELPFDLLFGNTSDNIVVQLDNGNALSGGGDIMSLITKYPGRAKTVHLKPYSHEKQFATMIGEDDIRWYEFISACKTVGGTDWYIVEYECEELYTPLEGVKKCIDALKSMEGKGQI